MKKTFFLVFFLLVGIDSFSQKNRNLKIVTVDGYLIQGYIYDSLNRIYNPNVCFFKNNDNKILYSVMFNDKSKVLTECCTNKTKQKINNEIASDISNFWLYSYEIIQDNSNSVEKNMILSNSFYNDSTGNVFLTYKVKARAIFYNKICKKYQNDWRYIGICKKALKAPFIMFLKGIEHKPLDNKDIIKLGLTKANFNKIPIFQCD